MFAAASHNSRDYTKQNYNRHNDAWKIRFIIGGNSSYYNLANFII